MADVEIGIHSDIYEYLIEIAKQERTTIEDILYELIDKNGDYCNKHHMIKTRLDYYPFSRICMGCKKDEDERIARLFQKDSD